MLIKDPSRFLVRNACSNDCVQLYQLVKQCYLEVMSDRRDQNENDLNQSNLQYQTNTTETGLTLLESFEEFVDCLGFGKRINRKVLDCLLIEDVHDGKIIALVTYSYSYFSYLGKEIHMNHFYVKPEYRLNGFGRNLMRNLIKLAADAKMNKLKYDVPRTSKGFCRFMQKLGAKDFTQQTGYCLFKMDLRTIDNKLN